MRRSFRILRDFLVAALCVATVTAQEAQAPFPFTLIVDAPTIAGRAVALDDQHKLLPWPMPKNIGFSYSRYFLSPWTILWHQYNRQQLLYLYCCFVMRLHESRSNSKTAKPYASTTSRTCTLRVLLSQLVAQPRRQNEGHRN
jgi:hypothetical protein